MAFMIKISSLAKFNVWLRAICLRRNLRNVAHPHTHTHKTNKKKKRKMMTNVFNVINIIH